MKDSRIGFKISFRKRFYLLIAFLALFSETGLFSLTGLAEVLRTENFSCENMTGFIFQYPVFKDWEPSAAKKSSETDNHCIIFLNRPLGLSFETPPRIIVIKKAYGEPGFMKEIPSNAATNGHGIRYHHANGIESGMQAVFYTDQFMVFVKVESILEKAGFSKDAFFKTVIETFEIQ